MKNMCELVNVSKSYANHMVLDNISMAVCEGEMVAITGKSGSGILVCERRELYKRYTRKSKRIFLNYREEKVCTSVIYKRSAKGGVKD